MSDSITAIGSTTVPALDPAVAANPNPVPSATTSSYADSTTTVPQGDGSVVITVTDAQGEIISATTILPHADPVVTPQPTHVLSLEA